MSHTETRLVMMANQIARAFARLPHEQAVRHTAEHMKSFWERRMFTQIFARIDAGNDGLNEIAREALASLRENTANVA